MNKRIFLLMVLGLVLFIHHDSFAEIGHLTNLGEVSTPKPTEQTDVNVTAITRSDLQKIADQLLIPKPMNQTEILKQIMIPEKIQPLIPYTPPIINTTTERSLQHHIINVLLSEGCNRLIQFNMTTDCPRIKDLIQFDTSNQHVSGKFIVKGNDVIRTKPQIKDHFLLYNTPVICVDCVSDYFNPDVSQNIILEPGAFTYINKTETSQNSRHFTTFGNQYIPDCNTATIAYSPELLNETIAYFLSGCTIPMKPANTTNNLISHPFLPKDSVQYNYNLYLSKIENMSKGLCINLAKCAIPSYGKKW